MSGGGMGVRFQISSCWLLTMQRLRLCRLIIRHEFCSYEVAANVSSMCECYLFPCTPGLKPIWSPVGWTPASNSVWHPCMLTFSYSILIDTFREITILLWFARNCGVISLQIMQFRYVDNHIWYDACNDTSAQILLHNGMGWRIWGAMSCFYDHTMDTWRACTE